MNCEGVRQFEANYRTGDCVSLTHITGMKARSILLTNLLCSMGRYNSSEPARSSAREPLGGLCSTSCEEVSLRRDVSPCWSSWDEPSLLSSSILGSCKVRCSVNRILSIRTIRSRTALFIRRTVWRQKVLVRCSQEQSTARCIPLSWLHTRTATGGLSARNRVTVMV